MACPFVPTALLPSSQLRASLPVRDVTRVVSCLRYRGTIRILLRLIRRLLPFLTPEAVFDVVLPSAETRVAKSLWLKGTGETMSMVVL